MEQKSASLYDKYARSPINVGRMNDPTCAAWLKGICGDTMEIYLTIKEKTITEALFYTDGCSSTFACGSLITELTRGRNIYDALKITPYQMITQLQQLPEDHHHCAVLAVMTLYKALADFLLKV
jgi:nitrogen fixation NifU-like protein